MTSTPPEGGEERRLQACIADCPGPGQSPVNCYELQEFASPGGCARDCPMWLLREYAEELGCDHLLEGGAEDEDADYIEEDYDADYIEEDYDADYIEEDHDEDVHDEEDPPEMEEEAEYYKLCDAPCVNKRKPGPGATSTCGSIGCAIETYKQWCAGADDGSCVFSQDFVEEVVAGPCYDEQRYHDHMRVTCYCDQVRLRRGANTPHTDTNHTHSSRRS
jgi:hypothetical protein